MLKDGDHSYVTLGTFLPDAVKSQVPVCIQNSLYLHTTMYLSLLFLHIWKTSEDSYNAAFGKLWKEECYTWAMPGFEPEVNSHFSMCYGSLNKHISIYKDAKSIPEVCPEHAFRHNCKQSKATFRQVSGFWPSSSVKHWAAVRRLYCTTGALLERGTG